MLKKNWKSFLTILFLAFNFSNKVFSQFVFKSKETELKKPALELDVPESGLKYKKIFASTRKEIKHDTSKNKEYIKKPNLCLYRHCGTGEKCQISESTGKAICVCKRHCKPVDQPVCGTNEKFYRNHCEMHRDSCLKKVDIQNAKHYDCFYKRYQCSKENFTKNVLETLIRTKRTKEDIYLDSSLEEEDDVYTDDEREDLIKSVFRDLDVDNDKLIGNKDIYEISKSLDLQASYSIDLFDPPCTLFHLINLHDSGKDHSVNIIEFFAAYNITTLQLEQPYKSVEVIKGGNPTIKCDIEGDENPVWRRLDRLIKPKPELQVQGRWLRITSVALDHIGNYSCNARRHGNLKQIISLNVMTKPSVEVYQASNRCMLGESYSFKCHVTSKPTPSRIYWLKDDKIVDTNDDDSKYLVLDGGRSLHINEATLEDGGSFTCVAVNPAGESKMMVDLIITDQITSMKTDYSFDLYDSPSFYLFHQNGVSSLEPQSCFLTSLISSNDPVPGLLRQNKLCDKNSNNERTCSWSTSVKAGSRNLYVGQPTENRVIVLDTKSQSIDEVIATDLYPTTLAYHKDLDEVYVICKDEFAGKPLTILLVIHSASISGFHSASRIVPSFNSVSLTSFDLSPEQTEVEDKQNYLSQSFRHEDSKYFDPNINYAFLVDKNGKKLRKLNLNSPHFDVEEIADLSSYNFTIEKVFFRPIGGYIDVVCTNDQGDVVENLSIDYLSGVLVEVTSESGNDFYDEQYLSKDGDFLARVSHVTGSATIYSIDNCGKIKLEVAIRISFSVTQVIFRKVPSDVGMDTIVHFISSQNGAIVTVSMETQSMETIDANLQHFDNETILTRFNFENKQLITPSRWYERFIATAGDNGISIYDVTLQEVTCRNEEVKNLHLVSWVDVGV